MLHIVNSFTPTSSAYTYLTMLILFCMLYHTYSTLLVLRYYAHFTHWNQTMLLHIQYVRKHILYIGYYTYSTIHNIRYYFTCYAVHAFLYVLRNTNCAKHTVPYMLYSACQAIHTTLHIVSWLHLPCVFYHRYYISLYWTVHAILLDLTMLLYFAHYTRHALLTRHTISHMLHCTCQTIPYCTLDLLDYT